ncbi:MAG: hypothetical protein NC548_44030 [Lachnospiraceae bacterium]|nr:hypothetical protein [Lachnospiraceae bacterium]
MNENIKKLNTVLFVLNQIGVNGKQNLLNLGGAIDMIEGVINDLAGTDENEAKEEGSAEEA